MASPSPPFLTALFFSTPTVLAALSEDSCLLVAGRWPSLSLSLPSIPCVSGAGWSRLLGAAPPSTEGGGGVSGLPS